MNPTTTTGPLIVVLLAVGMLAAFDILQRLRQKNLHLLFACIFGTLCSVAILRLGTALLTPGGDVSSYTAALAVLLVVLGWKALFGPWEAETKAAVLGTFLFWLGLVFLDTVDASVRRMHLLAGIAALLPAAIWCSLFLKYHAERRSTVLLMFFAGVLSTIPILFYDALVRHGVELHFFLIRIVPESFHRTASDFVYSTLGVERGLTGTLLASFVAFLIVGVIEEVSKFWVLRRSGQGIFSSIDDVLQLSIIVAVGFSFAENIVNPVYFQGFVAEYLIQPDHPDIIGFLSGILGRSVLTSMVHIVATGVTGYFLGLAIFAHPYLIEQRAAGRKHRITHRIARWLRMNDEKIFRVEMITTGLLSAILLHAIFNMLVTLPDLLPGNPRSLGDLLGSSFTPFRLVPLLLVPALLYVVGGFWFLTSLFLRKQNMEERGHLVTEETFVKR